MFRPLSDQPQARPIAQPAIWDSCGIGLCMPRIACAEAARQQAEFLRVYSFRTRAMRQWAAAATSGRGGDRSAEKIHRVSTLGNYTEQAGNPVVDLLFKVHRRIDEKDIHVTFRLPRPATALI